MSSPSLPHLLVDEPVPELLRRAVGLRADARGVHTAAAGQAARARRIRLVVQEAALQVALRQAEVADLDLEQSEENKGVVDSAKGLIRQRGITSRFLCYFSILVPGEIK